MRRREFISLLGGAATVWPLAARAQQPATPTIGYLSARSPDDTTHLLAAFRRGLSGTGFAEGRNVTIEYSWALGQYDRLSSMAAGLVRRRVSVLATSGGDPAALAAKAATATIPIVSTFSGDPVEAGLVAALNRPGGNVTGVTLLTAMLEPKRLGLLRDVLPQATAIGVLLNPNNPPAENQLRGVQSAARMMNLTIQVLRASTDREIDQAFETIGQQRVHALAVAADPFFDTRRDKLVALAAQHSVPTMYHFREFVAAGGLLSYGIDPTEVYRQLGIYTGQVLNGVKPAELPVMQAAKFEFVINIKTARALDIKFSDNLLSLADEVIE
jgi:putative tryptophan/tyrosine transport system substrate-binding protein